MTLGKLGTLTIGQAPRSDFVAMLDAHLPASATCIHSGVLDGLSLSEIEARFRPRAGESTLLSKLLTGESVILGESAVGTALQHKVESLEAQGCTMILIMCTGKFDKLNCKSAWLIEPDRILPPAVAALAGRRKVGIVVPLASQIERGYEKWAALSKSPICAAASPYCDGANRPLVEAAQDLRDRGAQMLVLDCIGFTDAHRRAAKAASGVPVIVSISLTARLLAELL